MSKGREMLSLMDYALFLLGRQRYTVEEMRKKLSARVVKINRKQNLETENGEKTPAVIARLQELNLLNDEEYAELYIRDQQQKKPQGLRLLKRNMAQKGLSKDIINEAVNAFSEDLSEKEYELAKYAAQKKLKSLTKYPQQKQREKLGRFLASRGFASNIIFRILGNRDEE